MFGTKILHEFVPSYVTQFRKKTKKRDVWQKSVTPLNGVPFFFYILIYSLVYSDIFRPLGQNDGNDESKTVITVNITFFSQF